MSTWEQTSDPAAAAASDVPQTAVSRLQAAWDRLEAWLERAGDRLNPILVKETRQAIKSKQFTITFTLVLAAVWIVTLAVAAYLGPGIYYGASGPDFYWWYQAILSFPLAVIVPFSAYRSLAAEREDNTYELLSISTLSPRQIIAGKLASAVVQMVVYLSAVAPCLVFTYLLRGIDVLTIAALLSYTILASLGLSMIGLLLATSAQQKYGQVILSVALVVGLVLAFFGGLGGSYGFIQEGQSLIAQEGFWIFNLALLTMYATTFALLFLAAAGQITFSSDNRSTPLRIAMVIQQACYLGWMGYAVLRAWEDFAGRGGPPVDEMVLVISTMAGIYWYVMGTMLTGEWPYLSQRVRRSLPQSTLGRTFLTWLNPGPGTGYIFAIANLTTIVLLGLMLTWVVFPSTARNPEMMSCYLLAGMGYIVFYLGLGKLVIQFLTRWVAVPLVGGILLHAFLVAAGCLVPMIIHVLLQEVQRTSVGYSLLHITNPFWSLMEMVDTGNLSPETSLLVILVPGAAAILFLLNLKSVLREVIVVRVAPPERVLEDEAQLHPPEPSKPQSPWDA